jgi:hypothetical protein
MVRFTIQMPEGALAALRKDPEEFKKELRIAAAAKWYELGEISQGIAAEIAGLSRAELLVALGRYRVSPFQYESADVLVREARGAGSRVEHLLEQALALPPDDRALLTAELGSAEGEGRPEEIAAAWEGEILPRIGEVERGETELLDGDEVVRDLREKLRKAISVRSRVRDLLNEVLALPPEDRTLLAAELEAAAGDGSAVELQATWDVEVLERIRKVERGEAQPSDWDDVLQRLSARHAAAESRPPGPRAMDVSFDDDMLVVVFDDGRELRVPLEWYPVLRDASGADRDQWRLIGGGIGIHWPMLDEDLEVRGLLAGPPLPPNGHGRRHP